MPIARSVVGVGATAVALTLGACGEGRAGDETVRQAAPDTAEVVGTEFRLDPETVRAARPGTIALRFVNEGRVDHALAVSGPQGERRTAAVAPGASAVLRVALPEGTYKLTCPLRDHAQRGMDGRLRVAE